MPGVGVALGGGGMKGLAHVGVLSVLEEHDTRVDFVAGASIGAVVGAFFAAGHSADEMASILRDESVPSLFTSPRFDGHGILRSEPFRQFLQEHLGDRTFADLGTPLVVACTDLEEGCSVVLDEGSVVEAVLASTAIPGLFAPVDVEGRKLVDGGLSNNLPVSILHDRQVRFSIGVRLFWQSVSWGRSTGTEVDDAEAENESWSELTALSERLTAWFMDNMPRGLADVQRSLDLVVKEHENLRLEMYPPDLLITPEVTEIGILEFHENSDILFERGVQAARSHADLFKQFSNRSLQDHDLPFVAEEGTAEFHRIICAHADQIKTRVLFDSAEEAEEAGYRPCKSCKPADRPITKRPE